MNVREMYHFIQSNFPSEKRDINQLAWPLHQPALGVQYVDAQGHTLPPLIVSPVDFQIPEPLGGPFYDLPVVGLTPVLPFRRWKQLRAVVQTQDGLTLSSVFQLHIKMGELKGLASKMGIQWYHVNFDWPWHYTCLPKLDDCVEYERKQVCKDRL